MSGDVLLRDMHRPDIALFGIRTRDERGGTANQGKEAGKAHKNYRNAGVGSGQAVGGGQFPPNAMVSKGLR